MLLSVWAQADGLFPSTQTQRGEARLSNPHQGQMLTPPLGRRGERLGMRSDAHIELFRTKTLDYAVINYHWIKSDRTLVWGQKWDPEGQNVAAQLTSVWNLMGPCCDLAPRHPDTTSWRLVSRIQRVGFELTRHAGSAGGGGVHPACLSGQPSLSRRSPHQTPWFSGLPPSPCPNMHGSAFLCLFINISQKNASLHFRLSVSRYFFTRCGSTNTHTDTHTHRHTHTTRTHILRASVRRLYLRLFLPLNKECDPQWRDYRTSTKTLSQCLQSPSLSLWLTQ